MIKHFIMIKLKDNSQKSKDEVKEKLLSMNGKVGMIQNLEVYTDFIASPRSYDVLLSTELCDEKALDEYQNDPYHMTIKAYIKEVADSVIAVDSLI